jgi:hypothetical protein
MESTFIFDTQTLAATETRTNTIMRFGATVHGKAQGGCYNCSQKGHHGKDCPEQRTCRNCHQPGHEQRDCPNASPAVNSGAVILAVHALDANASAFAVSSDSKSATPQSDPAVVSPATSAPCAESATSAPCAESVVAAREAAYSAAALAAAEAYPAEECAALGALAPPDDAAAVSRGRSSATPPGDAAAVSPATSVPYAELAPAVAFVGGDEFESDGGEDDDDALARLTRARKAVAATRLSLTQVCNASVRYMPVSDVATGGVRHWCARVMAVSDARTGAARHPVLRRRRRAARVRRRFVGTPLPPCFNAIRAFAGSGKTRLDPSPNRAGLGSMRG